MRFALEIPPGLNTDDTALASAPAWADGSNMRFRLGRPQVIGGWESIISTSVTGVCRKVFAWTENGGVQDLAMGTHSGLHVWQSGGLSDVTPTLALAASSLGADPFATTNTTPTIVVTQTGHPYIIGDSIIISGASVVATVTINGTWTITAVTANTWTFTAGSNANATSTGGGSSAIATPQRPFTGGEIDGSGSSGYGTGAYGVGGYGEPSTTDYFPMTWSLGAYGQTLIASPRNQTIFQWSNVLATPAAPIAGAPANVTFALVAPTRQVFALGCNEEASGAFNPLCIRHSGISALTNWTTLSSSASTAREYILPGGGRIVAGAMIGKYLAVWTTHNLFLGTYVGQVNKVWQFDRVGDHCGLIGPNAVAVMGSTAYWISPDRQFHAYSLGGAVQTVACPIREDFADNLAAAQSDKITATTIAEFSEVRFDYPDGREGYENSRYISVCVAGPDAGSWHKGIMARTAMTDAGPAPYPVGVTYDGMFYWHEKGASADGGALSWFIESADVYMDENRVIKARQAFPDMADQTGPVEMTLTTRFYTQGDATVRGPYTITPGQDKVDIMASGRLIRVKFAGNSAPSYVRPGRVLFEATQTSGR